MFDIGSTELMLVAIVALVVIGPKDLPKAMRVVGYWVGRARSISRQFRSGFDAMVREAELAEMEKKWAEENERIMREHPTPGAGSLPTPSGAASEGPDAGELPATAEKPMIRDEPGDDGSPDAQRPHSDGDPRE